MATKTFEDYFAGKGALPGGDLIESDSLLVLRSGTVFQGKVNAIAAFAYMEDNATITTINTIDVWESIGGTLVEGDHTTNFTFAANQYTFIGDNQLHPSAITASISLSKSGPGFENFDVGVFVNDIQVGTAMQAASEQGIVAFTSTLVTHTLQANDVVDIRVRNRTGTTDVTITNAQLRIG